MLLDDRRRQHNLGRRLVCRAALSNTCWLSMALSGDGVGDTRALPVVSSGDGIGSGSTTRAQETRTSNAPAIKAHVRARMQGGINPRPAYVYTQQYVRCVARRRRFIRPQVCDLGLRLRRDPERGQLDPFGDEQTVDPPDGSSTFGHTAPAE